MSTDVRRSYRVERDVRAPADLVWALATDTNRWNRLVGFAEPTWAMEEVEWNGVREVRRIGRLPMYWGKEARFREIGSWIEGKSLHAERAFLDGHWRSCGFVLRVQPTDGGCHVEMDGWVHFKRPPAPEVDAALDDKMLPSMRRYFDLIEEVLQPVAALPRSLDDSPCTFLRAQLVAQRVAPELVGPSTPANAEELAVVGRRFAQRLGDPSLAGRMIDLVRDRADDELRALRPFELAAAWQLDERSLLRAFLIGTETGLFELRWSAICPVCRVSAGDFGKLHATTPDVACQSCGGEFPVDLSANLEATFRVHPAVRPIQQQLYCDSSPWHQAHLFALMPVAARQQVRLETAAMPAELVVSIHDPEVLSARWHGEPGTIHLGTFCDVTWDGSAFTLHNHTDDWVVVLFERPQVGRVCKASDLLNVPEFLDRFADDAPRAGGELAIGEATLVFADITGSTALYEELGDARAFSLVQGYFHAIEHIAERFGGALVKTMGDGVMVTFPSAQAGMRAALAMQLPQERLDPRLRLKIGLHTGPCLIVGANGRIDFFGTSVNIAARLAGLAKGGQIVVLRNFLQRAVVGKILEDEGLAGQVFPTQLKGLRDAYECVSLTR